MTTDCDVTVRFGRIGTNGQEQTKSFADAAAAAKHVDKLIAEKTAKGYQPVRNAGKTSPRGSPLPRYSGGEGSGVRGANPRKTQGFARDAVPLTPTLSPRSTGGRGSRNRQTVFRRGSLLRFFHHAALPRSSVRTV